MSPPQDTETLAKTWVELKLLPLPEEFRWKYIGRQYLKQVQTIIKQSDKLRPIWDSQTLDAIAKNTNATAGIIPDFNLREYQEALLESYGNVKLDSLDTDGSAYNQLKLWTIFIPQNVREVHDLMPEAIHELPKDYYQKLLESGQLEQEIDQKELEKSKKLYYQQPIKSVLDVIKDSQGYRYLVVLGDPGSGKSTLLQYLALEWARTDITTALSLPIPLLIELRTYIRNRDIGQCKDFLEFCHQSSGAICHLNQHHLDQQLKDNGKFLVMFDGLDEVFEPGKREDVITDIHRFTNTYPKVRLIVTSRVIGYKPQRLRDAEFRHVMLQDLDSEQIQTFIEQWHELTFTDQADKVRKRERLQKAIKTSSPIRQLGQNPLLLTMMAILNRNQELPRDRSELYNQSSRLLLHQWDVERALLEDNRLDPMTIDYQDKQQILAKVAYFMQGNQQGLAGNLISAEDLERIIFDELKSREFTNPRAVAKVMINQLRTRNFILCFMGTDYYAFVHRTFLEYFCAWEFVRKFEKTQEISLEQLKTQVFGQHWGDESWHEVLRLIVGMIDSNKAGEIIEYLMAQDGAGDKFGNLFLAADCLSEVRNRYEIKSTDTELLNRVKYLIDYYLNYYYDQYGDEATLVRDIVTKSLVRHIRTKALVRDIGTKAIILVATHWQNHPDTLALLQKSAHSDTDLWLRLTAIEQLAQGYKDHPDTYALLQQSARSDTDSDVRVTAIAQLAQGYKDHPDTYALLQQSARSDTDSWVRVTAIEQLVQGWHDRVAWPTVNQPWLFEFLCNRTLHDPFERKQRWDDNPRQAALKAILEYYPNHSQTRSLLQDRADHDSDPKLREFAQEELARLSSFSS
ncbi:NACHT domain-containing protein [Moorena sp. SIO1G6]|uniref:NACHT domain-containing protein n=1 Tax=Moorena sp. SIO1G6 TaxID=2607840 RepID=UPI00257E9E0A|nr:NACHT domain-containing protein [Moorena sp. SIO1G6]